ncbi:hypothetical protein BU198_11840 [Streptomyces sp. CBMA156]|nr:hypothetical protein [Streptomyces sp. CBMA156]
MNANDSAPRVVVGVDGSPSSYAELLVVGSHGRGGFTRALLGSVSAHCAQYATCPVVIVRARD